MVVMVVGVVSVIEMVLVVSDSGDGAVPHTPCTLYGGVMERRQGGGAS